MSNETPPPEPTPYWLNPLMEVKTDDPHPDKASFIIQCLEALLELGLSFDQALGVAANTMNETGWGRFYRAWNLGGVKINRLMASPESRWWKAPGHVSQGDSVWCYYCAYASLKAFMDYWVGHFIPKPGTSNGRYKKTGEAFWADKPWFGELIAAGYKGPVTQKHPDGSIHEHDQIEDILGRYWAQHVVGATVDGSWGPASVHAAKTWQEAANKPQTGRYQDVLTAYGSKLFLPKPVAPAPAPPPPVPPPAPTPAAEEPVLELSTDPPVAKETTPGPVAGPQESGSKKAPKGK